MPYGRSYNQIVSRLSLQVEHDDRYLDVGFQGRHGIDGYVVSCESGEVVDGRHCKGVIRLFVNDPVGTYRLFKRSESASEHPIMP